MPIQIPDVKKLVAKVRKDRFLSKLLIAAAFTRSGDIIAIAQNRSFEMAPFSSDKNDMAKFNVHAEDNLIRKLRKLKARERYSELYVLVIRLKHKSLGIAKPCENCAKILMNYNVDGIFYTNEDGVIDYYE